jgi:tripartite ATP-independent transporter DctP family solute receptor
MKKWFLLVLLVALGFPLVISPNSTGAPASVVIRVGHAHPPENLWAQAFVKFKETIEQRSGGRVQVQIFGGGQLGNTASMMDQVKSGTLTMTQTTPGWMTAYAPQIGVLSLPFLFKNREAAFRVLDGPIGQQLWSNVERAGFKVLGCAEVGWRVTVNKIRPLATPDDFRGIKIRVQPIRVHLETFRLLGANPVAMDFSELYTALRQNVIDAVDNPASIVWEQRYYEVTQYLTTTTFFWEPHCRWMNKGAWDRMPQDLQRLVMQVSLESVAWQRSLQEADNQDKLEKLVAGGMRRNDWTPEAYEMFRRRVAPVYETFANEFGRELINTLVREGQR